MSHKSSESRVARHLSVLFRAHQWSHWQKQPEDSAHKERDELLLGNIVYCTAQCNMLPWCRNHQAGQNNNCLSCHHDSICQNCCKESTCQVRFRAEFTASIQNNNSSGIHQNCCQALTMGLAINCTIPLWYQGCWHESYCPRLPDYLCWCHERHAADGVCSGLRSDLIGVG